MSSEIIPIWQILDNDYEGTCDNCGICCTHVSINSPMPDGSTFVKPAGVRCKHLTKDSLCGVWGNKDEQPDVCIRIRPMNSLCRFDLRDQPDGTDQHISYLEKLESMTTPESD